MISTLNRRIREALEQHPDADPRMLAEMIATDLTPKQTRDYFLLLLTSRIIDVVRNITTGHLNDVFNQPAMPEPVNTGGGSSRRKKATPRNSPKFRARRSPWMKMLEDDVRLNGKPKKIGDCTRDDLLMLIDIRRIQVGQLENQISHYERLLALLTEYDVDTVREIPEEAWSA